MVVRAQVGQEGLSWVGRLWFTRSSGQPPTVTVVGKSRESVLREIKRILESELPEGERLPSRIDLDS